MRKARLILAVAGTLVTVVLSRTASAEVNSTSTGLANTASAPRPAASFAAGQASLAGQPRFSAQSIQLAPPSTSVSKAKRAHYERRPGVGNVLMHQWSPFDRSLPPELQANSGYLLPRDSSASALSLKQVVYLAIRNNPGLQAEILDPLAAEQSVREANAAFDPLLTSQLDEKKDVIPTITNFSRVGAQSFSRKRYDWNFGMTKLLSTTNGSLFLTFDNSRFLSNAREWTVNPSYNPSLALSVTQPLLRNFGFDFATINVRLAELSQKQSQYTLEQHLSDFVLQVATEYWNVVRAEQNLQVTVGAMKLAEDLLNQDLARLRLGMVAQIDVQEAQAETESWRAAIFVAQNTLTTARARLRQEVMLNPKRAILAEQIEPSDSPTGNSNVTLDEEQSLEAAIEYRPELGAMREAIRSLLLQVRFAENQTLPQLSVGARIGVSSTAGSVNCFQFHDIPLHNCVIGSQQGTELPFRGIYGDALNRLWNFSFYDYAVVLNFEMPLSNDYAKAALAQARIEYDQQRLRYQEQIAQVALDVETALSNVKTSAERMRATDAASDYARAALSAEEARYHAGAANTHELLQYQQELISALASQVQAQLDLETAQLALKHAQGTLLSSFQINFAVEDPHRSPWYTRF